MKEICKMLAGSVRMVDYIDHSRFSLFLCYIFPMFLTFSKNTLKFSYPGLTFTSM